MKSEVEWQQKLPALNGNKMFLKNVPPYIRRLEMPFKVHEVKDIFF